MTYSTADPGHLRVGIAQQAPVWGNRAATIELVLSTIADAAAQGVRLLVFPVTFLPGYPFWVCRTDGAARGEGAADPNAFALRCRNLVADAFRCGFSLELGDPAVVSFTRRHASHKAMHKRASRQFNIGWSQYYSGGAAVK